MLMKLTPASDKSSQWWVVEFVSQEICRRVVWVEKRWLILDRKNNIQRRKQLKHEVTAWF